MVSMGVNNLQQSLEDAVDPRDLLESIKSALKDADAIVSQLISSSLANRLKMANCDLLNFVEGMLEIMSETISGAGITVELKLENTRPIALMAVEEMRQVFVNIVLNAIQSTPEKGKIIIRVGERKVGQGEAGLKSSRIGAKLMPGNMGAAFEIEDAGPGFSELELEKLFDPFFKGGVSGPGAGLGMTVAKQLVELHGGIITVENKTFGSGAKVTVMLRLKPSISV